jgi:hypothetical protein
MQLGFVGGTGGEGTAVTLPEGVAFRLPKGSGIMLNTHFLNSYGETLEGHTVIDFKFAEADPSRKIASFFSHGTTQIQIPAKGRAEASTECVIREDMEFIFFTSHLHEYGSFGQSELTRAGTSTREMVHSGDWIPEYQAASQWSVWDKAAPMIFRAGDTLRTTCRWENTTAEPMQFPREMCFGVGFFLTDAPAAPDCLDGEYL